VSTTGSGSVDNSAGITTVHQPEYSGTQLAQYYTQTSYKLGAVAVRFRANFSGLAANSERFAGFALSDLSQGVYLHLSGASTEEFKTQAGSGSATQALTTVVTAFHEFEIVWASNLAKLYIDRVLTATLTTHVPTGDMPIMFAGQKI
jgi:hypothetical protein